MMYVIYIVWGFVERNGANLSNKKNDFEQWI